MTEPLLPRDPVRIGGHRLLARLGAGGMGVVYLGRSQAGALAAVKVVHPDLAAEGDFRTRFRREAEAARRVHSPWATPVTGAGPDDAVPWLATAFVPGPSLGEAVRRFGPLPTASVRALGRMLAAALREVHAAGIVHRDVKPGNVLLAIDGPRLIDFGIARSTDQTAITGAGVVAGTPGFLSPEQAQAHTAALGPAGDVFSLGCLLAYAATGRAPFGGGTVEAVLYRTVHDAPDLAGIGTRDPAVPANPAEAADPSGAPGPADPAGAELLRLLHDCLAKDPAVRPTAAQVESRLTDTAPAGAAWLPENVVRDIADRSARMLTLPDIDPTTLDAVGGGQPARTSRRRLLQLASGAGVLAAGGGTALWALTRDGGSGGGGKAHRWALGVQADLSGAGKMVGRALEDGARLAVEQYNARHDKPFTLHLRTADDEGSEQRSKAAAKRLADDLDVLAALGPNTTRTAVQALPAYDEALLPVLFVVPGSVDLLTEPCRSAVHCRARDSDLAYWLAVYLIGHAKVSHPGLLVSRLESTYAAEMGQTVSAVLHDNKKPPYPRVVPYGVTDFGDTVEDILAAKVDSFVFAGTAQGAADVARRLAAAGFDGPRVGSQAQVVPAFIELAGEAAEGWVMTTSFVDPAEEPRAKSFVAAYRRRFDRAPDYFAAEAYDVANLTIRELVKATKGGRPPSRQQLVGLLRGAHYRGIAKPYAFHEDTGRFAGDDAVLYRVEGGKFRFFGGSADRK